MKLKLISSNLMFTTVLSLFISGSPPQIAANHPPSIKILNPSNNSTFEWNELIHYSISVLDKEDGNSEYNEIAANEVVLKVQFLRGSEVQKYFSEKTNNIDIQSGGLSLITSSGCFSCHTIKNKLIGPSFELVTKKYGNKPASVTYLSKKITQGSTGVWGNVVMPAHSDLKASDASRIVQWILKYSTNADVDYYAGTEGTFRTKNKPAQKTGDGVYVLTATYQDHGDQVSHQAKKSAKHSIIIKTGN